MAKIYYRKYHNMVVNGECTLDEAIEMARAEVPERWRDEVVAMLEADREG